MLSNVSVSFPHLVDLSIGTPEIGAVNFNALHRLLHAIVKKLNISELEPDVDKTFTLSNATHTSAHSGNEVEDLDRPTLQSLNEKVSNIEHDMKVFYPKLPNAKEMSSLIKSDRPIADLWHLLSLTKREEANATGVKTAMDLIQEIFDTLKYLTSGLDKVNEEVSQLQTDCANKEDLDAVTAKVDDLRAEVDNLGVVKEFFGESYRQSPKPVTQNAMSITSLPPDDAVRSTSVSVQIEVVADAAVTAAAADSRDDKQIDMVPKLDEIMDELNSLKAMVGTYPTGSNIVTWPQLEDVLNGIRTNQLPMTSRKPLKSATSETEKVEPVLSSGSIAGPTEDCLELLEKLGGADERLNDLTDQVEHLNELISRNVEPYLPENIAKQLEQLNSIAADFADWENMKAKLNDLEVLLSDIPEAHDDQLPQLGDKSRVSFSTFSLSRAPSNTPLDLAQPSSFIALGTASKHLVDQPLQHTVSPSSSRSIQIKSKGPESKKQHQDPFARLKSQTPMRPSAESVPQFRVPSGSITDNVGKPATDIGMSSPTPSLPVKSDDSPPHSKDSNRPRRHRIPSLSSPTVTLFSKPEKLSPITQDRKTGADNNALDTIPDPLTETTSTKHPVTPTLDTKTQKMFLPSGAPRQELSDHQLTAHKPKLPRHHKEKIRQVLDASKDKTLEPSSSALPKKRASKEEVLGKQPDSKFVDEEEKYDIDVPDDDSVVISEYTNIDRDESASISKEQKLPDVDRRPKTRTQRGEKLLPRQYAPENAPHSRRQLKSPKPSGISISNDITNATKLKQPEHIDSTTASDGTATANIPAEKSRLRMYDDNAVSEGTRSVSNIGTPHASTPEISGRFNRTLREVVEKDYMPEIRRLQQRMAKLENRPAYQIELKDSRQPPTSNVDNVLNRLDDLRDETNRHVQEMDNQLRTVLDHNPVDEESVRRTQLAIGDLQAQLTTLRSLTLQLKSESDSAIALLKEMKFELARLDEEKVDNRTLASELDHKVNLEDMELKVDNTQLEVVTHDLHKLIDDLLTKLVSLEDAWRRAHMKLEGDVNEKVSEENISKLKQAIEKKIKRLHQKIKEQQDMLLPSADEAAAMRRQLPFNCLSCDKPVYGYQYCVGDNNSLHKIGPSSLRYSQSDIDQLHRHIQRSSPSTDCVSLQQLRKRNLKAYMVQLNKEQQPKVFITRSKTRATVPGVTDLYAKPRACGGKHTITQYKLQGQIVQAGKTQSLKGVFETEEFVAAGVLKQEEQVLKGADGRSYKSRANIIQVDDELTQAIHTNKDPSLPIVEEMRFP